MQQPATKTQKTTLFQNNGSGALFSTRKLNFGRFIKALVFEEEKEGIILQHWF